MDPNEFEQIETSVQQRTSIRISTQRPWNTTRMLTPFSDNQNKHHLLIQHIKIEE